MPISKKRKSSTMTVAKAGTVSLNTRIARILSRVIETKRFNADSSIGLTATGVLGCYMNFLSGITQGSGQSNRVGDQILLDHIKITVLVQAQTAVASTLDTLSRIVVCKSSDNGLTATSLTNLTFIDLVYSGFNVTGPINTNNYKLYKDTKHYQKGRELPTVVGGMYKIELTHYFKNEKVQFRAGTNDVISGSHLVILQGKLFGGAISDPWTYFMGTTVAFRDA